MTLLDARVALFPEGNAMQDKEVLEIMFREEFIRNVHVGHLGAS